MNCEINIDVIMAGGTRSAQNKDYLAVNSTDVTGLGVFDTRCDATKLGLEWKRWLRAFKLFVLAKGIADDKQKVALLLHTGGLDLQEIYYTLAGEEVEKTYVECVQILTDYFSPQTNVSFERHGFRQLEQAPGETVDQFVCKLRQKVRSCEYWDADEAIRDQLVEKCINVKVRRRFLERGATGGTLKDFQDIARAVEAVEMQMQALAPPQHSGINAVRTKRKVTSGSDFKSDKELRCFRCNRVGHMSRDKNCPARDRDCKSCGKKGHFQVVCRNKGQLPSDKNKEQSSGDKKSKQANQVTDGSKQYAFVVSGGTKRDGTISLVVGGVELNDVLIDSGATCNVTDVATWENLKKQGVKCLSTTTGADKKLFSYAQRKPLTMKGLFVAEVECKSTKSKCKAEFIVIHENADTIVCKQTAEALDILRVGPARQAVNIVQEENGVDFKREFSEVFTGVGKLKNYVLKLHLNESVKPAAQKVRRIPFGLRDKVDAKLDELLNLDIIEQVEDTPTEWVSPLVVVPKSNNDIRICVDMRQANEAVIRERQPIPTIDEILYDLNGSTVFSKLDLKWGFHQIELEPQSRAITTFVTHRGLYRYKRLMFGITSAPEKYQKIIADVLMNCSGVVNICDDIIVHDQGQGIERHDANVRKVLTVLRENGLTLNEKCRFRMHKLTFFGHDLGKDGISPSEEKIAAVKNAKPPNEVSTVRSFLGLVQYSAKFIPNLAEVAEPLQELTRRNEKFVWNQRRQTAFDKLKTLLSNAETLAYFKGSCKTRIIADAGPTGLGAVLTQLQNGDWRVVSYASRNLSDVERRYSQTEKEALALVWACERFSLYVLGRSFELETDHKPLECIYGKKSKPSARIERWVLRLQGYDYCVVYRPGKTNIADALSRLNNVKSKDKSAEKEDIVRSVVVTHTPAALTPTEIEKASDSDSELQCLQEYIKNGNWNDCKLLQYLGVKDELCSYGRLVLRGSRIVIPKSLRQSVLEQAHEGHQGIVKTKTRLRTKVWWPKIDYDAEKMCRSCHGCQVVGEYGPPEPMKRVEPPSGPWQDVAVDLMGPLPSGESLLVIVDYYSRYFEVKVMKSTTTESILKVLDMVFSCFGYPFSLKSDNGTNFVSVNFDAYLRERGIMHVTSPPLWPQANGEVERQNRTLLKALKVAAVEKKDWRVELNKFLLAFRSTPHASTGRTPAFLMFGRELRSKLPELRRDKSVLDEEVRDRDWQKKLQAKAYADNRRSAVPKGVEPGDQVLLKNTRESGKLAPNFEQDPYTVTRREGAEVTVEQNGVNYRRNSAHVKAYVPPANRPTETETVLESPEVRVRPSRTVKMPAKFDDFILNK